MLSTQVVANLGHGVAVHFQPATLYLFGEECTDAVVYKTLVLYQIVDNGALACAQSPGYAYGYHTLNLYSSLASSSLALTIFFFRPDL